MVCQAFHFLRDERRTDARRPSESTSRAPQEEGEHLRRRESTSGGGRAPQEQGEHSLSLLLCSVTSLGLTLCDPVDCGPPGSSVHGILQARILACVAVSFCRGLPNQRTVT